MVPLEITMGTFVRDGMPYFVGIAQDITARKQAETERIELLTRERTAREKAEAAVRTRDEVLAIVSHDLRNPLNTISLAVGALESGDVPAEEVPRTVQVVRRAVDRMNRLIEDLLDVAKLEAGQKLAIDTGAAGHQDRGRGDVRRPRRRGRAQAACAWTARSPTTCPPSAATGIASSRCSRTSSATP